MKNITTAAQRAGVHHIECPHCKRKLNTAALLERVFQAILELVRDGHIVNVPKFGMFRSIVMRGRSNPTPIMASVGGSASWGERKVMKWKQSAHARRVMNPEISEITAARTAKGAKKRAETARRELKAVHDQKERVRAADRRRTKKKAAKRAKRKRSTNGE